MNQRIIVRVATDGNTEVRTEGFAGGSCRQASELIERALGDQKSEQLTQEFYMTSTDAGTNTLQSGGGQ